MIKNLKDKLPSFKEGNNRTTKGIMNAWVGSLHVDNMTGALYVIAEQLHTILRLGSRSDGQYLVDSISKDDQILETAKDKRYCEFQMVDRTIG